MPFIILLYFFYAQNVLGITMPIIRSSCGNQHHSHELLMMGIVMPKTC